MQHAAEVADKKDGTYSVSLKPKKAGPFDLMLSLEGPPGTPAQKRSYAGMCIAHVAAVDKCSVCGAIAELVAGQPGKLTLARADRSDTSLVLVSLRSLGMGPACFCSVRHDTQRDTRHTHFASPRSPAHSPPLACKTW